jgi:hypothetical protein
LTLTDSGLGDLSKISVVGADVFSKNVEIAKETPKIESKAAAEVTAPKPKPVAVETPPSAPKRQEQPAPKRQEEPAPQIQKKAETRIKEFPEPTPHVVQKEQIPKSKASIVSSFKMQEFCRNATLPPQPAKVEAPSRIVYNDLKVRELPAGKFKAVLLTGML